MIVITDPDTLPKKIVLGIGLLIFIIISLWFVPAPVTEPLFTINPILTFVVYRLHRISDFSVFEGGNFSFDNQTQKL